MSKINEFMEKGKEVINKGLNNFKDRKILLFSVLIIIISIISSFIYISIQSNLNIKNCLNLKRIYTKNSRLISIPDNNKYNLRDFYIKTAYNCCCSGQFKNDFVNLCALETCISQGVRCLDFEIYSMDNKPVVAASSVNDYSTKGTYNSLPLSSVFNTIATQAFSSGTCSNYNDPLILHFRIMSNNCKMYNEFANVIKNNSAFHSKTLGKSYSYENHGHNLGTEPISQFKGKIIIMVDNSNPLYQHTKLDEFINITSGSGTPFMRFFRFKDIKYNQDMNLKEFNKKNMSIVLPDISPFDKNIDFNLARSYGCQFIGMSFQNYDNKLIQYNNFFNSKRSAFVLKPKNQRFIPLTIPIPSPAKEEYSYKPRHIKTNYYSLKI